MKNKWDNLKRSYTIFMELKNSATGLGWNEIRQIVDCDDKWWEEHLAVSVTSCSTSISCWAVPYFLCI
jgi:hypothetical protein